MTLENINSLAGTWKIDFTDAAFNGGIFILHGATGAGKTSILDALCLALYGKTSRQNSFNKTQNEVMTKGTASCFAEAEFEAGKKRYRAFWEHKRTRRGEDFQAGCTRKLYAGGEGEGWTLLAERTGEVGKEIAAILGMDFEQFTSAVLLPQGKFDAFLTAEKRQRSEILEKISRTRIYSRIGAAVHRRHTQEDAKLASLNDRIAEIIVLDEDEAAALAEALAAARLALEKSRAEAARTDLLLAGFEAYKKHQDEIGSLNKRIEAVERAAKQQEENFAGLEKAKRAAAIADTVLRSGQARREKERLENEVGTIRPALEAAKESCAKLAPQKAAAQEKAEAAEKALAENEPLIRRARELDIRIGEAKNNVAGARKKIEALEKTNAALEAELLFGEEKRTAIRARIGALQTKAAELRGELERNTAARDEALTQTASLTAFSPNAGFEQNRKSLADGEPCPLCGSLRHPFCDNEAELRQKQSRLAALQAENARLAKLVADGGRAAVKLDEERRNTEKEAAGFEAQEAARRAALQGNAGQLAGLRREAEAAETEAAALTRERAAIGAIGLDGGGGTSAIDGLERRLKAERDQSAFSFAVLDKKLSEHTRDADNYSRQLEERERQHALVSAEAAERQKLVKAAFAYSGFGGSDDWKAFNWSTDRIAQTESEKARLSSDLKNARERREVLVSALEKMTPPDSGGEDLHKRKREIAAAIERTSVEIGANGERLERNRTEKERRGKLEADIAAQTLIAARWARMDGWIGGNEGWKFKNYVQAVTLKFLIYNAAPYLDSMSGGRYTMVCGADTGKDSGKDKESDELLPVIIDRYQGSARRSISNLSGGERFMLSLSLALGLSTLSSSKLSIDSLFLDEGFGALDKESLELTINILNGLKQHQGKLTGVISHVEELKERISASIEVIKTGGGKSRLSGCGVSAAGASALLPCL